MEKEQLLNQTYTPPVEFTFNFNRLVKEVDTLMKDRLEYGVHTLANSTFESCEKLTEHANKQKDDFDTFYRVAVQGVLSDIKNDLIAELNRGRSIINISESRSFSVSHEDHPQFESIIEDLLSYKKTMLVGKAGTGKTYMAEQFAGKMELPFYKYSASRDASVHDLLGYKQPRSEEYLETAFLNAYENGGVFLVDEFDAMSSDMALFFNGVADNSPTISIPHRDTKPVAHKHKDFYLIFCGNTWGEGSIEYTGRDFQDMALLDRFRFSRHEVGYHTPLEQKLCNTIASYLYSDVIALRQALERKNSYLSTRNIEDMVKYLYMKLYTRIEIVHSEGRSVLRSDYLPYYKTCVQKLCYNMDSLERESLFNELNLNAVPEYTPESASTVETGSVYVENIDNLPF